MKRVHVISRAMRSVGYDAKKKILEVEFPAHTIYDYIGVPLKVYKALMEADSKGSYYNTYIKEVYPFNQIQ